VTNISQTTDRTPGMMAAHIYLSRKLMEREQRLGAVSRLLAVIALVAVAVASFYAATGFAHSEQFEREVSENA